MGAISSGHKGGYLSHHALAEEANVLWIVDEFRGLYAESPEAVVVLEGECRQGHVKVGDRGAVVEGRGCATDQLQFGEVTSGISHIRAEAPSRRVIGERERMDNGA